MMELATDAIQWTGCITALIATAILAMKLPGERWAWVFYMISNWMWISYGVITDAPALVVMNLAFTITSLIGVIRTWVIEPRRLRSTQEPVLG